MDRRSFFRTVGGGLVLTPVLALRQEKLKDVSLDLSDAVWDEPVRKPIAGVFWMEDTEGNVVGMRSIHLDGPTKEPDGRVSWNAAPQHYGSGELPSCVLESCVIAVQWEDIVPPEAGLPLHGEKLFRTPLSTKPVRWAAIEGNTITVDHPSFSIS